MNQEDAHTPEAIAVIGMSGRFPDAGTPDEFWSNLMAGKDSITRFPARTADDGSRYVGARSMIAGPDLFDAAFFNIYPKEAELMDPQHRIFLECAWEALEDGCCDPGEYQGLIGVYAGLSLNTYLLHNLGTGAELARNYQVSEYQTMLGNDKDFLPVRVSYKLNLRGPSMTIQSACSTSLVAICQAATGLLTYQCDMALAGGVSISFPGERDYLYQEDGMVSPDGTCRAFDADAAGTVFGHGCGVVLLKRLSEAIADGDPILAVIKGWAVNNDGSDKVGFAAPGVNAQADVIALAQASAGVSPADVSYIEAHGTGTPLGDPIEVAGLTKAFREGGAEGTGFCALGTGKTHIGHLDCAAGVTGLIKTVLQLRHEKIPALLHFKTPNPRIDFASSPFRPVDRVLDWKPGEKPRLAGVSAFGVGGTNAHVIVAEAPVPAATSPGRGQEVLVLSARSPEAVQSAAIRLAENLAGAGADLSDVAFTLAKGRRTFKHRIALTASNTGDAVDRLRQTPKSVLAPNSPPKVAFVFPGQGSQYVGMTRSIYESEPAFRSALDECAVLLRPLIIQDIRTIIYPNNDGQEAAVHNIQRTALTQPCIFAVEYSLAKLWISLGVTPSLFIGHSIGEYVAAVLAGTFKLEHALQLLATRAMLMQNLPEGGMLAIRKAADALNLPPGIDLAAVNSPTLCTVSGTHEAIADYQKFLESQDIQCRVLKTSHAFHSAMMDPIVGTFAQDAAMVPASAPVTPWISTCTGRLMDAETLADPAYWSRQLRQTVRFSDALESALADENILILEVGPGQALAQFARQHPARGNAPVVATLPSSSADAADILAAMGELWKNGVSIDWDAHFAGQTRAKLHLPTYPFERKSFWIDNSASVVAPTIPSPPAASPTAASLPIPPPQPAMSPANRLPEIETKLIALVRELSGIDVSDPTATFTELGFDSLFLTQASQAVQSRFGVKITFRQMLGDLSSVSMLSRHLDANMPATATPPPAPAAQALAAPSQASSDGGSPLEQLLANNMRIMQTLLEDRKPAAPAPQGPPPVTWPAHLTRTAAASARFGPYKPIEKGEKGGLTENQQRSLDALIARYTARTAGSKAYTAEHRPHFADPRAVSGFKSLWKEMVYPIVSSGSKGARIRDIDGNEYVDITMGFGTYFFGHSPDWLVEALEEQLKTGIEIGPQSAVAGKLAKAICDLTGMERATFCNTGSEAVMAAMRLARTITGRNRIAYFTGDYHGMFEEVLVRGAWVDGVYKAQPIAPGIPQSLVENMLVLDYADPASLEILRAHAHELAAVMVEPVQSRAPGLQPREFMHEVRAITRDAGTALIFDEVVTGFRCAPGGAQEYFGVRADMATYGKVIGGGMPIGVLAGSREFLDALDGGAWSYGDDSFPEVGVTFFAGTFVRHPLAMAAAWRVVQHLMGEGPRLQIDMEERLARLCRTLNRYFDEAGVPIRIPHFSAYAVIEHAPDLKYASLLWYYLRENGVHVWEGRPLYFTTAHTDEDLDAVVRGFVKSVSQMQADGFLPAPQRVGLPAPDFFPRHDSAPTTEAQREIFHAVLMGDEANCAFNESNIIRMKGDLDISVLKSALHDIVVRHPALRSTFSEDGSTQHFHPSPRTIDLTEHDFSGFDRDSPSTRLPISLVKRTESATPFDLTNGPLVRFQLIRLAGGENELIFSAHHMVCDGWSFGMILGELAAAYNARRAGRLPVLPPAMSFADYARMEVENADSQETLDAGNYWINRFANGAPVLDLPTDRPRDVMKTYRGAMECITLDSERFERLKKASPQLGGTLFSTLLASFATLLHRLTGQNDVVIGVPAAGQTRIGKDELIGHCLNFLPLRLSPSADRQFRSFAKEVKEQVLEAYDHQNHTFGSLIRKLKLPRDTSRVPLVSVIFNIDKNGTDQIRFDGLELEVETNPKQFVNFDLFFNLVQTDHRLVVECEYNTDLHDRSTIIGWLDAFEKLIEASIKDGDTPLGSLEMLTNEDFRKLDAWNQTDGPIPPQPGMHRLFEERAYHHPHAVALRAGSRGFTYQEIDRHANAMAFELQRNGVTRETLVAICAERSPELIVAILAVLKAGGAYVPIDPKYPAERIAYILNDTAATVLLTNKALTASLPAGDGHQRIYIDEALRYSSDRVESTTIPSDLALVIYTSGSTGNPKGVAVEHRNVLALIGWALSAYQPEELAGVFFSTSACFDVSVFEIFATLSSGGCLILAENALALPDHPNRDAITLLSMVPSAVNALLDAKAIPLTVKVINLAGEVLSEVLADRVHAAVPGIRVIDAYGPSEDTTYSTWAERRPGAPATIGRPITNTRAYVVDTQGKPMPPGAAGELLLGGAGLARGYLNRPELTAEKFIIHPRFGRVYKTGDRARFLDNGELQFLGRLDHQIKLRGYRIELGEIEAQLETHPAVSKAVVHTHDDRLVAYVTARPNPDTTDGTHIWKDQWDMLYQAAIDQTGGRGLDRLDSVIAGWAGVENLDSQVSEWIDTTVDRIRSIRGRRVFEIGCGTGQLISRLAADCECYWAADISKVAIDALLHATPLPQVKLLHRAADDFSGVPERHFDTVIINSVTQYFPSAEYLTGVISGALGTLRPGGRVYLGDIQSRALLPVHHAMALRENAPLDTSAGELRNRTAQRVAVETELSIDPAWFDCLQSRVHGISQVEIQLRRGSILNETTTYHYDVVLHTEPAPPAMIPPPASDWRNLNIEQLEAILNERPATHCFTNIPDARLAAALGFSKALEACAPDAPIPQVPGVPTSAVTAEEIHAVAAQAGYGAAIRWKNNGIDGLMDAVLYPLALKFLPIWPRQTCENWESLANTPHSAEKPATDIRETLRKHLADRLPEYMVPSSFVVLDAFPVTGSGKVDRNLLPKPETDSAPSASTTLRAPANEVEEKLLAIWKQVLGNDTIGTSDDIFALGGDSILIFQISTRARQAGMAITPAMIFRHRTIEALAADAPTSAPAPAAPTIQRVNRDAYRRNS